jgi:surface carbohydrate biosynthesis protein
MSRPRTPLIVPSEVQTREFDAKLLLACLATERGFDSIVGCRTDIHLHIADLPRGIYLAKDVRFSSRRMFGILSKLGSPIVALDEEAPFFYSRQFYLQARVSEAVLHETEALFAWGPENAEAWRHCPYYHGAPVHETGNPRVDMMRPELRRFFDAEVDALRDRLGRYILINTNFGSLNHFFPNLSTLLPPDMTGGAPRDADDAFKAGLAAHRHTIFRAFLELLPRLCRAFPDRLIVVRPHPAENHDTWRQAGAGCDNLRVIHEGNVIAWLLAADAVIHNSCTTGFEAYLVGAPVIAFQPAVSDRFDLRLPNELSHRVRDFDGVIDAVGAAIQGRLAPAEDERSRQHALAAQHVAALEGRLASDRIVDLLDRFEASMRPERPGLATRLAGHVDALARRKKKERNVATPGHKNNVDYTRHRFPGIELDEVNLRIDRLRGILGRFPRARACQLGENIFEVTAV